MIIGHFEPDKTVSNDSRLRMYHLRGFPERDRKNTDTTVTILNPIVIDIMIMYVFQRERES